MSYTQFVIWNCSFFLVLLDVWPWLSWLSLSFVILAIGIQCLGVERWVLAIVAIPLIVVQTFAETAVWQVFVKKQLYSLFCGYRLTA